MESNSRRRGWLTSPVHQGDHGGAVNTIAQGMPFVSGGPCKCACVFLLLHAKLRVHRASGIPCALTLSKAREFSCKTRAHGVARSRRCVYSPPTHARSAWRGGVGGGGCLHVLSSIEFAEAPPPPTPPRNAQE